MRRFLSLTIFLLLLQPSFVQADFYRRLIGLEEPKIACHQLQSAMAEVRRGKLTALQVATAFNLTVAERVQAQDLITRIQADLLTAAEMHDVCLLGEYGIFYNSETTMKTRYGVP